MRSSPTPALHNVLVARPGTNSTAVVRRDDLLAAAVLAADEREPRRRSVLALMHRRWARISASLRRRRPNPTSSSTQAAQAAAALAATDPPFRAIERNEAVLAFDRERQRVSRRIEQQDNQTTSSNQAKQQQPTTTHHPQKRTSSVGAASTGPTSAGRRVRQFGAKDDDDTLLMLPRVASVSFSGADTESNTSKTPTPRVRQLPRVSALMPMRAPRPVQPESPLSSDGRGSMDSVATYDEQNDHMDETSSDEHVAENEQRRRALHRLPTGMTNVDVERAMERAVVEIASDEDDDTASDSPPRTESVPDPAIDLAQIPDPVTIISRQSGEDKAGEVRNPINTSTSYRSRTLAHRNRPRQYTDDIQVAAAFTRRVNSSASAYLQRRMYSQDDVTTIAENKMRLQKSYDCTLFEDDYLSFQGFHGHTQPNSMRSQYQSMSALLRSRRISSITDSHSEGSDQSTEHVKTLASSDARRKGTKRPSFLSNMFWNRKHTASVV